MRRPTNSSLYPQGLKYKIVSGNIAFYSSIFSIVYKVHCDDLDCYSTCTEEEFGGECDACPVGMDGNGTYCSIHLDEPECEDLGCFNSTCIENDVDGLICAPCPKFFIGDGFTCEDSRIFCEEMECFGECVDGQNGGRCAPCPDFFSGNGTICVDSRIHCEDLTCFGNCTETPTGGVCDSCPQFFAGNGTICEDERIHCEELDCFGECEETPSGGVCEECPEFFEGDGVTCEDQRIFCENLGKGLFFKKND